MRKKKSSKEIYPAKPKGKPYGGKEDGECEEQYKEKIPARTPNTFRNDLRKMKKEYKG